MRSKKIAKDSIVYRVTTRFAEFSMKSYTYSEIASKMEKLICEYIFFGGVPPDPNILTTNSSPSEFFLKIFHYL